VKEYDKRKGHLSNKHRVLYISSNNVRHPVGNSVGNRTLSVRYTTRNTAYFYSLYIRWICLNKLCRVYRDCRCKIVWEEHSDRQSSDPGACDIVLEDSIFLGGRGIYQCLNPICVVLTFYVSISTRKYRAFNLKRNALKESTSLYQYCYPQTDDVPLSAILSTTRHRADDINCCTATDDGHLSAILSTTRHRADDNNCCTATDDVPLSAILSTTRHRADINCCTATDDGHLSAILSTTRHRADDINCCTATDDDPRSAVFSTTRSRADNINCCTATDDDHRSAVFSIARARITPCSRYAYILRRFRRPPNNCLILGYDSVQSGINCLTCRRSLISSSRNEVASFPKLRLSLYQITWRQTPKYDVLKHFRSSDVQKSTFIFIRNCSINVFV